MKKRILSTLLAVVMCLSLLPTAALAESLDTGYLDADGQERQRSGCTVVTSSTGDVTWTSGWYVVNGHDVTINGSVTITGDVHLILRDSMELTVERGISGTAGSLTVYGQSDSSGYLTVMGSDRSGDETYVSSAGIRVQNLTVNGGNVCAIGGGASNSGGSAGSYGVYAKDVTVNGGSLIAGGEPSEAEDSTVNVSSDSENDYAKGAGIYAYGTLRVTGGEVTGGGAWTSTTGKASAYSYGIYAGSMTVSGGTVTANAYFSDSVSGDAHSYGVYAADALSVTGGEINAGGNGATSEPGDSGEASAYSSGIYVSGPVSITGGTVNASGAASSSTHGSVSSMGLYTAKTLSVTGGTLTADTGSASVPSDCGIAGSTYTYGVYAEGEVTISGEVTATAGDATGLLQNYESEKAASYGLYTPAQLTVNGGKLTAASGRADLNNDNSSYSKTYSYGVYAGDMAVSGGEVTAVGGPEDTDDDTASNSCGIKTDRTLSISGGKLTAVGKDTDCFSEGIYAVESMTVTGGTVSAEGGDVASSGQAYSCGIYTTRLTVSGGKIAEAQGGAVTSASSSYVSSCGIDTTVMTVTGGIVEQVRRGAAATDGGSSQIKNHDLSAVNLDVCGGTIDAEVTSNKNVLVSGGTVTTLNISGTAAPCLTGGIFGKIQYQDLKNALADGYAYYQKNTDGAYEIVKITTLSQYTGQGQFTDVKVDAHTCEFQLTGSYYACVEDGGCGRGYVTGEEPVAYLDRSGNLRQHVGYDVVTDGTDALTDRWYVVKDTVEVDALKVNGNVHLILCNGAELKASQIKHEYTDNSFANLTVYAQPASATDGDPVAAYDVDGNDGDVDATGRLTVNNTENDGIDLHGGILTVAGGNVSATGLYTGLSCDLNVLGGTVTATGKSTGLDCGSLTVTGGELTAAALGDSMSASGISVDSLMTVTGGKVNAVAGPAVTLGSQYATRSSGISFENQGMNLTVSGNGEVTATGGSGPNSYGIHGGSSSLTVTGSGKITATADTTTDGSFGSYGDSSGIYFKTLTVSDKGKITATAAAPAINPMAVACTDLTMTGGTLKAVTYDSENSISVSGDVTVASEGTLTVSGGKVDCEELTILGTANISGGTMAGKIMVGDMNNGIHASVNISGGTFNQIVNALAGNITISGGIFEKVFITSATDSTLSGGTFDELQLQMAIGGGYSPTLLDILADGYAFYTKNTNTEIKPETEMGAGGFIQISVVRNAQIKAYIADNDNGGNSGNNNSGSGGGGSSNTTSSTVTNPNGSTTTTTTNKVTGAVTETTKNPNGVTGSTVTDKNGNVTDISAKVPASAVKDGETVTIPVDAVKPADKSENAPAIKVDVPTGGATIEIPVDAPTPGTVVVIVDKNGNETIVPGSKVTENGIEVTLPEDATIKVIDNSKNFDDVRSSDYFADAVKWASARNITGGLTESTFAPHASCTRAQIVTFLWRAAGSPEPKAASSFTDVSADAYYAKAVAWAVENGITNGFADGTFGVNTPCTRAQAVAFLFRYAASRGMDAVTLQELVSGFGDADSVPSYALSAFNWALAGGIVTGNNGNLMPNNTCTRAQIVTFLYRLLGK